MEEKLFPYFHKCNMFIIYFFIFFPYFLPQPISGSVGESSIVLTCENQRDMDLTRKIPRNYNGQTNIIIKCEAGRMIDREVWENLLKIKFKYILFLPEGYRFTPGDYEYISRFQASTIANLFPETAIKKKILRDGKPAKIYEPLIGGNIYSQAELDNCERKSGTDVSALGECLRYLSK